MPAHEVISPNGRVALTVTVGAGSGRLSYSVRYKDRPVVLDSALGLDLKDAPPLDGKFEIANVARSSRNDQWKPPYGERSVIPDRYSEAVVDLKETDNLRRRMQVTFRAYDEGAAFCYTIPRQACMSDVTVAAEKTEFAFAEGTFGWSTTSAQGTYSRLPIREITKPAERPLTLELAGGLLASVAEARMVGYSRMRLVRSAAAENTLIAALAGPVASPLPLVTPWRVIFVAERPGELLEHDYLLLNLNPPCEIQDASWIRPGKVIREVTLSTTGGRACVDFAVAHNLQYVEYDAGWYGHEYDDAADARHVSVDPKRNLKRDLDLPAVMEYAKSKGIGIWLYVNRRALERQLDEILPLYAAWGAKGVKYGFVNVGTQQWSAWLHEAVRKAARHRLMVDIHDEYRPTGFSRTWPNLLTQEGIGGNETMPTATHNTVLPFTRFVCGAADYTICYYTERIKTTHAHQLALAAAYYSPLQFVFWYDSPASWRGEPEIEFFERVPTVWDDTRVLSGRIGEHAVIARRSGAEWFVGTLTNVDARTLDVPLEFLDAGRKYAAHLYEDAEPDAGSRTNVRIRRFIVDARQSVKAALRPSGGQAMRIVPATADEVSALPKYPG